MSREDKQGLAAQDYNELYRPQQGPAPYNHQAQYPQGQYPQGQYPQGQYPQGQYPPSYPPAYSAPAPTPAPTPVTIQNIQQPSTNNTTVVVANMGYSSYPYVPDYLGWSIVNTLFCCFFFGIAAIVFSAMARDQRLQGDIESARKNGRVAFWINLSSMLLGLITVIVLIALSAAGSFKTQSIANDYVNAANSYQSYYSYEYTHHSYSFSTPSYSFK